MARKREISVKRNLESKENKPGIFSQFKLTQSYTSLILGAIVVLVIGILFISFARGNRIMQTSSTKEEPKMEQQKSQKKSETVGNDDSKTSSIYTIKPGDDLWSISENVYQDGHKWIEIAKANKLENPGLIHVGNKLITPEIEKRSIAIQANNSTQEQNKIVKSNAISGSTYTIKEGDNLWDICVRAYGDGYKWVKIARVNNLENPDLIYSDKILQLPR